MLPVPGELMPSVLGLALAAAARSAIVLYGPSALAPTTIGAWLTRVIAWKSRSRLYGMVAANTAGLTANSPECAISNV